MQTVLSLGLIVLVVIAIALIIGAVFIIKAVSMYKQSEKDKKYDEMLKQPLEKFGDDNIEDLAKKYEDK